MHQGAYVEACNLNGWKNQLPGSTSELGMTEKSSGLDEPSRPPFSHKLLQQLLLEFIIGDDQVRKAQHHSFLYLTLLLVNQCH